MPPYGPLLLSRDKHLGIGMFCQKKILLQCLFNHLNIWTKNIKLSNEIKLQSVKFFHTKCKTFRSTIYRRRIFKVISQKRITTLTTTYPYYFCSNFICYKINFMHNFLSLQRMCMCFSPCLGVYKRMEWIDHKGIEWNEIYLIKGNEWKRKECNKIN